MFIKWTEIADPRSRSTNLSCTASAVTAHAFRLPPPSKALTQMTWRNEFKVDVHQRCGTLRPTDFPLLRREVWGLLLYGCQREIGKRTFSYAGVRTHATLAVLLSSIALYPALLGILAAAVT